MNYPKPGLTDVMKPVPDHGETSYKGFRPPCREESGDYRW
jgi:hypothetical protein